MSTASIDGRADGGIRRRVEHVMGMPISLALRGRHTSSLAAERAWHAVINRLQNAKGGASFNNLIQDCKVKAPFAVDFARHAESMGALARHAQSLAELAEALDWAKTTDRTTVISIVTDAFTWSPGDAWWDVGVPQTSARASVQEAAKAQEEGRKRQRVGV